MPDDRPSALRRVVLGRGPERSIPAVLAVTAWTFLATPLAGQDPAAGQDTSTAPDLAVEAPAGAALEVLPVVDSLPAEAPPDFEAAELARSRECVPLLAQLASVDSRIAPLRRSAARIEQLHRAVFVEDSLRVTPLAEDDSLEQAVREWFRSDMELALRYLESEDEAVRDERRSRREAMLSRLQEAFDEVNGEIDEILASAEGLEEAVRRCQGRIFVLSAVREACGGGAESPVCEAARDTAATGRFVESARDLWDIEQLRPWSDPSRIQPTPQGGLGGARTGSTTRRGNLAFSVGLEPLIQSRSSLSEEQEAGFDARLDSLGIRFDHPDFAMVPSMTFELDLPDRLGAETHYVLHFGDLSDPARDVIRRFPVPGTWPARAAFPPREATLVRLVQGEPVNLTAVRIPEDGSEGEAIFGMSLTPVRQAESVNALLGYMLEGHLSEDLADLVPPEGEGADGSDGSNGPDGSGGSDGPESPR